MAALSETVDRTDSRDKNGLPSVGKYECSLCFVVTHEGSGLGGVPKTMKDSCRGAKFGESLAVQGSKTPKSENTIAGWAKKAVLAN